MTTKAVVFVFAMLAVAQAALDLSGVSAPAPITEPYRGAR